MVIYAQGLWCNSCGFFEEDAPMGSDDTCLSCGCDEDDHSRTKVVDEDD